MNASLSAAVTGAGPGPANRRLVIMRSAGWDVVLLQEHGVIAVQWTRARPAGLLALRVRAHRRWRAASRVDLVTAWVAATDRGPPRRPIGALYVARCNWGSTKRAAPSPGRRLACRLAGVRELSASPSEPRARGRAKGPPGPPASAPTRKSSSEKYTEDEHRIARGKFHSGPCARVREGAPTPIPAQKIIHHRQRPPPMDPCARPRRSD